MADKKYIGHDCIGYGEYRNKCTNIIVNPKRNPYWCERCDQLRINHITKMLNEMKQELSNG